MTSQQLEEATLFNRYKEGDVKAGHELVMQHLPLWYSTAQKYAFLWNNDKEETLQQGVLNALATLESPFDPTKGGRFTHYAVLRMRGVFTNELKKRKTNGALETPVIQSDILDEVAADPRPNPEKVALRRSEVAQMEKVVAALPEKEREVIRRRWLAGPEVVPFREVSAHIGVSIGRTKQLEQAALEGIRRNLWSNT